MITATTGPETQEALVGMGQIAAGRPPLKMRAIVGSCIALALHDPRFQFGVLAHIVLPDSAGRGGGPGKFADTAVPKMLEMFKDAHVPTQNVTAKIAGGANMFNSTGPLQIGDANIEAVAKALRKAGIRVAAEDVGGGHGRRVTFDCKDGQMLVESANQPTRTL